MVKISNFKLLVQQGLGSCLTKLSSALFRFVAVIESNSLQFKGNTIAFNFQIFVRQDSRNMTWI